MTTGSANSICAIRTGARQVGGSARRFGAGAGNTPTEALVTCCDKLGIETGVDAPGLFAVGEEVVLPVMKQETVRSRAALIMGYAGVYSSFLGHAYRLGDNCDVSAGQILLECGRRKLVGGQEDQMIEIAAGLAAARSEV